MESAAVSTDPGGGVAAGRIVHFVVGHSDLDRMRELGGNHVAPGDTLAALIVKVWSPSDPSVNLKVFMDGPRDYWATSVPFADVALEVQAAIIAQGGSFTYPDRTWHWPPRV